MKTIILLLCAFFTMMCAYAIDPITGPGTVCTGATITLSNTTTGGVWSTGAGAPGTIDALGVLTGISAGVVTVTYTVGGPYVTTDVTVNPIPVLTSATTASVCDNALFTYTPTGSEPGATFSWNRPFVVGVPALAGSGAGVISEVLNSTVSFPVVVAYIYTVSVGGCSSVQTVNVTVQPHAVLSNPSLSLTVCSGSPFVFNPTSTTFGVTYYWSRPFVSGIASLAATGSGSISETLVNSTFGPITVVYTYSLTVGGCTYTQPVTVTVQVPPNAGTVSGTDTLCQGENSTFSATVTGGVWGSVTGNASVSASGVASGVNPGTDTVTYAVTNACGTMASRKAVWVKSTEECITMLSQVEQAVAPIYVYPNPSAGTFSFSVAQWVTEDVFVTITDIAGRHVLELTLPANGKRTIYLQNISAGVYMITASTSAGAYRRRAVVTN